ncbi:MAG TPA: DNA/RNA nuclease SfsA [Firmicutes bacterium]|nr:DNA/RNA nuclease SfsA [Bacillota bacterium]
MQKSVSIKFGDLHKGSFLERPNRFIVRCRIDDGGEEVEAHLADPGRLKELLLPGAVLYLSPADNPSRKTRWSASLVLAPDGVTLVSLQSTMANRMVAKALEQRAIPDLADWELKRAEYTLGRSRWDFYLEHPQGKRLLLEVKSCTLVQDWIAMFPDAVTERGRRHVQELTRLKANGDFETGVLFVVQRRDGKEFRPAKHIDPAFANALVIAHERGVKLMAYNCLVDATGITWGRRLGITLS